MNSSILYPISFWPGVEFLLLATLINFTFIHVSFPFSLHISLPPILADFSSTFISQCPPLNPFCCLHPLRLLASKLSEFSLHNNTIMHANLFYFLFHLLFTSLKQKEGNRRGEEEEEEKQRGSPCDGEWWWHRVLPRSLFTALSATSQPNRELEHYIARNA